MAVEIREIESVMNASAMTEPQRIVRAAYHAYDFLTVAEVVLSPHWCVLAVSQGLDGAIWAVRSEDYYQNSLDPIGARRNSCRITGKLKEVVRLCGLLVFVYE